MSLLSLFNTESSRVGVVLGLFLLYLTIYFVAGPSLLGLVPEIIVIVGSLWLAIHCIRRSSSITQLFFVFLALSFLADFINISLLQIENVLKRPITLGIDDWDSIDDILGLSTVFFTSSLFAWNCAWAVCTFRLASKMKGGNWYLLGFPFFIIALSLFFWYQLDQDSFNFNVAADRIKFINLALGIVGVQLGLLCVIMNMGRAYLLMIVGFALGTGNDVIDVWATVSEPSIAGAVQLDSLVSIITIGQIDKWFETGYFNPLWAFAKSITLMGMLILPGFATHEPDKNAIRITASTEERSHSPLSALLLLFWFVSIAIAMLVVNRWGEYPHWITIFIILFSLACVVIISTITSRFDHAVQYLTEWIKELFEGKLESVDSHPAKSSVSRWLTFTALDNTLETARKSAEQLAENVIFLGPERLNRPPSRVEKSGDISCFLIMPFSPEWSEPVSRVMRTVCKETNVRAVRGDDMLNTSDILDDIWTGIIEADFVIADVTDANANVFYELGMAHAIGTPVIILAQDVGNVPFDIASRRMITYEIDNLKELKKKLKEFVVSLLEKYELRSKTD